LESYKFLSKTPDNSLIIGDSETLRYISDPQRGFFALPNHKIIRLSSNLEKGYFIFNIPNLIRLNLDKYYLKANSLTNSMHTNKLYNNGDVLVFFS
jgi:hypothetical protein